MMVFDHDAGALSEIDRRAISAIPPGGNWRDLPEDFPSERVKQIRAGAARGDGTRSTYYGRLDWDSTAATIATYFVRPGNGANIHPSAPRTLTFREAARLQGFQDSVQFFGSGRARAMQIGNAVPPPVAAAIANALPHRGLAIELFAGAGGMSAGLHAAGFEVLEAIDSDPAALRTLQSHVPVSRSPRVADLSNETVREEIAASIIAAAGKQRVALLAGGPPCQGFSTAGANRVSDDPRNDLPNAFLWFVERLRPRQVMFENVAALAWKSRRPWFDRLLGTLHAAGYAVAWRIVHCEAFGLPQRRRRIVVVCTDRDSPFRFPRGAHAILEPAYRKAAQDVVEDAPRPPSVRDAIGNLPSEASARRDVAVPLVEDGCASMFRQYVTGRMSLREYVRHVTAPPRDMVQRRAC